MDLQDTKHAPFRQRFHADYSADFAAVSGDTNFCGAARLKAVDWYPFGSGFGFRHRRTLHQNVVAKAEDHEAEPQTVEMLVACLVAETPVGLSRKRDSDVGGEELVQALDDFIFVSALPLFQLALLYRFPDQWSRSAVTGEQIERNVGGLVVSLEVGPVKSDSPTLSPEPAERRPARENDHTKISRIAQQPIYLFDGVFRVEPLGDGQICPPAMKCTGERRSVHH